MTLASKLQARAHRGWLRVLRASTGLIDFTSNDYFGFARAKRDLPGLPGATGSRLLTGHTPFHDQLESTIAAFHHADSCILYNSGYVANLGLLSALGTPDTTFLYDLEIHASMIDGMCLSAAKKLPFRHNDLSSLERRLKTARPPTYVLIESLYSISGDWSPIAQIADLCERYEAKLIVDEAHATGICGPNGSGLVCQEQLETHVFARVYTFSKALGAHGACILGSEQLRQYLINFSRPLIYTTALPPLVLAHISASYEQMKCEAAEHQKRLQHLIRYFNRKSGRGDHSSPIIPLVIPDCTQLRSLAETLRCKGLDVRPLLPPTVPRGRACLRVVLHSFNQESEIDRLVEALG